MGSMLVSSLHAIVMRASLLLGLRLSLLGLPFERRTAGGTTKEVWRPTYLHVIVTKKYKGIQHIKAHTQKQHAFVFWRVTQQKKIE